MEFFAILANLFNFAHRFSILQSGSIITNHFEVLASAYLATDTNIRWISVRVKTDEVVNDLKTAMKRMFSKRARARGQLEFWVHFHH